MKGGTTNLESGIEKHVTNLRGHWV